MLHAWRQDRGQYRERQVRAQTQETPPRRLTPGPGWTGANKRDDTIQARHVSIAGIYLERWDVQIEGPRVLPRVQRLAGLELRSPVFVEETPMPFTALRTVDEARHAQFVRH